jgi:hypothetical protein
MYENCDSEKMGHHHSKFSNKPVGRLIADRRCNCKSIETGGLAEHCDWRTDTRTLATWSFETWDVDDYNTCGGLLTQPRQVTSQFISSRHPYTKSLVPTPRLLVLPVQCTQYCCSLFNFALSYTPSHVIVCCIFVVPNFC